MDLARILKEPPAAAVTRAGARPTVRNQPQANDENLDRLPFLTCGPKMAGEQPHAKSVTQKRMPREFVVQPPAARRHLPSIPLMLSAPIHALERGVAAAVRTVSCLVGSTYVRLAAHVARQDAFAADKIEIGHHRV